MANLEENVQQAISDFNSIKSAIETRGAITIGNTPTKEYGDFILAIPVEDIYEVFNKFLLNEGIGELVFPEGLTAIPNSFCLKKKSLTGIVFPSSLLTVGSSAFHSCQISTLVIPKGITTLGQYSFGFGVLEKITLPNTLTSIDDTAFFQNTKLSSVTLEQGFNCSLNLQSSTNYSVETLVGMLNALADRTGKDTATLTLGSANLSKLTDAQKGIATQKNWILA